MKAACFFCKAEEELPEGMEEPVVCDRLECMAKAYEYGRDVVLADYIESKLGPDGEMMFRLKNHAE